MGYKDLLRQLRGEVRLPLYGLDPNKNAINCQLWPQTLGIQTPSESLSTSEYMTEALVKHTRDFECHQRTAKTRATDAAPECFERKIAKVGDTFFLPQTAHLRT